MPLRPRPKPKPQGPWHWHASTPTVLYLNDLEDIWTLLQSLDAPVRAETDQFLDIESLDDLRALHGKPAKWMRISVGKAEPRVSVELGHGHTQFTIHSVSHTHVGVLEQFKHIVWRHWRQFAWASFGPIAALLLWLIAVVQVARGLLMLDGLTIVTGLLLAGIGAVAYVTGEWDRREHWVTLPMVRFEERSPSFLVRNRDAIILGIVFVLIGWAIGQWTPLQIK
jgi:hypothetical protein